MKRIPPAFGLVLLCSLSLALPAAAQQQPSAGQQEPAAAWQKPVPPGSARAQLDAFSAGLETLHARFEQQVVSTDGAVEDRSSGEVWLQRPQRFRWEYGGDFPEVVVADGERVWIYDEALEQVTVEDQSAGELASPLTLLTDPGRLDEQFAVREAGETYGLQLLELRAHSEENDFERILLGLRNGALELMIMEDAFGLRTELRFHDVERNPAVDETRFSFTPPEGVDVVGDVAIIRPLEPK
jgi:outer membrane lipoprotein carrier protein